MNLRTEQAFIPPCGAIPTAKATSSFGVAKSCYLDRGETIGGWMRESSVRPSCSTGYSKHYPFMNNQSKRYPIKLPAACLGMFCDVAESSAERARPSKDRV